MILPSGIGLVTPAKLLIQLFNPGIKSDIISRMDFLKPSMSLLSEFRLARFSPKRSVLPLSFLNLFYKFCRNPAPYFIAADFGFFQNNRPCSNYRSIADFHSGHDDAFCTDRNIIADINDCMGQVPAFDGMRIQ